MERVKTCSQLSYFSKNVCVYWKGNYIYWIYLFCPCIVIVTFDYVGTHSQSYFWHHTHTHIYTYVYLLNCKDSKILIYFQTVAFHLNMNVGIFTSTLAFLLACDGLGRCVCYRIRSMNGRIWLVSCVHLEEFVCNVSPHQDQHQVWVCFLCQVWSLGNWPTQVRMYSSALLLSKFSQFVRWQPLKHTTRAWECTSLK
jgi:hypothetical protein